MAKAPKRGRVSIFRGKAGGKRVQGILTKRGGRDFDLTRHSLAVLYESVTGRKPVTVSDADVIEYLAIGEAETRKYLERYAAR